MIDPELANVIDRADFEQLLEIAHDNHKGPFGDTSISDAILRRLMEIEKSTNVIITVEIWGIFYELCPFRSALEKYADERLGNDDQE